MKKLTFLKSLLLAIGLLAGNIGAWAQTCDISDDFTTLTASTSYASVETTAHWKGTNTAVLQGGTTNSNPTFTFIGSDATTKALCINGKTTAVGVITSPTLSGGCSSISFKYGHPFSETNGAKFTVAIKQNGTTVWSEQVVNTSMTLNTAYTYSKTGLTITGDFTLVITNNSPSNSTSNNKDRVAIWGICISKYSGGTSPAATPTFDPAAGTYTSAQSVTISCTTEGASIYYTTDGSDPDNTKTQYTGAISVTSTTTIKAIAYADGYDPSAIASATYTINVAPTITVTEVTLPAFSATAGSSQDQTITVNGTNLTGNITLALSGTDAAVFSLSESSITPTAGSVTDKVITITYAPTAPGSHSATLTLSSSGATDVTRDLTGTATLAKPTVNTASNIGKTALTLNWNAVTGATSYEVNVYTKTTGTVTATDLFISEYVEGSSNNKALEIFNGTGADVDLSQYSLKKQTNGAGEYKDEKSLSGTLANGDVYVIANSSASDAIKAKADLTENLITAFNGNDAIGLFKNGTQIDEVGVFNQPADWGKDVTLVRKSTVTSPKVPYDANDWNSLATDYIDNLGSHTMDGFGTINNPVSGSPFTTTETSLQVSGLTAATTYYYTVTAKNGTYVSPASDEASASTLGTATPNVSVQGIFVRNGKVIVTAPAAGESIEIFNAVGQHLVSTLSTAGENEIAVPAKGILLVKAGSQVTKVMMP